MNLTKILNMFGVKISPEHIAKLEELIPKVPEIIQVGIAKINHAISRNDARLAALERSNQEILQELRNVRGNRIDSQDGADARPAGVGATQLAIERGESIGLGAD